MSRKVYMVKQGRFELVRDAFGVVREDALCS